ncbi:IS66 family transposase [Roseobacter sinensis]|uniref:IS66 family transposase n=1 Tax=Roseobacter sinensis TaxID=2931391 RepID=A0ABT3BKR3_9RHOB|nr:IS66 family transposase [Roseobacter sp. WL0113]MCV3274145.1 IS66 family transposase [Roseobacter sp. WL0113]
MLKDLDITPDDPAELRAVNRLLADEVKSQALLIEKLKHQLAGQNRHRFGTRSESLDQLNLTFEEDEAIVQAAEEQAKAAQPAPEDKTPRQHSRKPLPDHLDRHDEVLSPGDDCTRCGGKLKTLGEDVTEELEYVPGRFIVNRILRPRKACAGCEAIVQSPLPSRPIERGRPGPGLLAHVLVSKYADHLPLYRQSQIYAREGIDLDRSTMADWVGRSTALLEPLADEIGRIVRRGDALFADDTPVKMQAPGNKKTKTARVWTYVRDERPWSGSSPPCAWYQFTIDRKGEHPVSHLAGYKGCVHADGYSGFNGLFGENKADEMACMAHVRRKFVDVFASQGNAIAEGAIRRIAELYAIEKEARGKSPDARVALRQSRSKPIFDDLEAWLHNQLPKISGKSSLAQAIRYALGRMPKARPCLENGHLELDNNTAERSVKPVAIGRKNWTFAGSEGGGKAMAIAYTLIETAKLNDVDPQAWLAWVLSQIADHKITRLDELFPWRYAASAA